MLIVSASSALYGIEICLISGHFIHILFSLLYEFEDQSLVERFHSIFFFCYNFNFQSFQTILGGNKLYW